MIKYIRIAIRNIVKQKRRSILLGSAIIVGTMIIVLSGSFSNGVGKNILRTGTALQTGHINLIGKWKERGRIYDKLVQSQELEKIISAIPGVQNVQGRIVSFVRVFNPDRALGSRVSIVHGVDINREFRLKKNLSIVAGDLSRFGQSGKVLVFQNLARKLKLKLGDTITLKAKIHTKKFGHTTGTLDLEVVAIAKNMVGGQLHRVITSLETLQKFYGYESNTLSRLMVYLDDVTSLQILKSKIEKIISKKRVVSKSDSSNPVKIFRKINDPTWKKGERVELSTYEDELQRQMMIKEVIDWISGLLAFVLAIVVFAGISNSLWMAVRERTAEVGTLRSIGMGRFSVLYMFLVEGIIMGAVAGLCGVGAGSLLSALLDMLGIGSSSPMLAAFLYKGQFSFLVNGTLLLNTFLLTLIVTALAGMLPALRAAHMKPINAINHIG